jgi:hypothetical protein
MNHANPGPGYKPTMLDRHGPDGALKLRAASYSLTVFGIATAACLLRGAPLMVTLLLPGTLAGLAYLGTMRIISAAGRAATYFTLGGSSTPYLDQYSQEQALVMQRDYAGALALYEQRITTSPADMRVRVAAAELYMTHGNNAARAAQLFREVQRTPGLPIGQDVYVSNKLADLYLGPLGEPKRALVEFRRLIERYPGSAAAKHARMALENLKSDLVGGQESS